MKGMSERESERLKGEKERKWERQEKRGHPLWMRMRYTETFTRFHCEFGGKNGRRGTVDTRRWSMLVDLHGVEEGGSRLSYRRSALEWILHWCRGVYFLFENAAAAAAVGVGFQCWKQPRCIDRWKRADDRVSCLFSSSSLPLLLSHSLHLLFSLSLSISLFLSNSLSFSFSLTFYLSLPLSLSIFLFPSYSLSFSFPLTLYLSLSLPLSLSLSFSVCLSRSLSLLPCTANSTIHAYLATSQRVNATDYNLQ